MLEGDAPRPPAREITLQGLGLTDTFERRLGDIGQQALDPFIGARLLMLPVRTILERPC